MLQIFLTAQLDTFLISCFEFWENISSNKGVLPFCSFWSVYKLYKTPPFIDLSIWIFMQVFSIKTIQIEPVSFIKCQSSSSLLFWKKNLQLSMTTLVEHSLAQPTECRFLLKNLIWTVDKTFFDWAHVGLLMSQQK